MIGERIEQARNLSGLSQDKLGKKLNVSKMTISKYENNILTPNSTMLINISKALDVGIDYFFRESSVTIVGEPVFRKRKALSKKNQDAILLKCCELLEKQKEIMQILNISQNVPDVPEKKRVDEFKEIDILSRDVRMRWNLGLGPIENLMEAVESNGFRVAVIDAPDEFDALTVRTSDGDIMIVLREGVSGDRQRFTLAHELGHYFISECEDIEKKANYFAESFLVPGDMLISDIGSQRRTIGINELHDLKMKYGASMRVILFRMLHLGIITESVFKRYQILFSKNGWNKTEPMSPYPSESPAQMRRWVNRAFEEGMIGMSKRRELLNEKISFDLGIGEA